MHHTGSMTAESAPGGQRAITFWKSTAVRRRKLPNRAEAVALISVPSIRVVHLDIRWSGARSTAATIPHQRTGANQAPGTLRRPGSSLHNSEADRRPRVTTEVSSLFTGADTCGLPLLNLDDIHRSGHVKVDFPTGHRSTDSTILI